MNPQVRLGTPTDYIDLCSGPYLFRGPDLSEPADGATRRTVASELQIAADTPDALWRARSAVERMLTRAEDAHRRRLPMSERVSLQLHYGTTGWTYIDITSGRLEAFEHHATGISAYCGMTLSCLPLLRTDAQQAQNLLDWPCDPTQAAWTRTNITATSGDDVAPDGSETAARLRETSATGMHEIRQQIAKDSAAETYTLSVYVKADGRAAVSLYLADGTGTNGAYVGFDVAAGYRLYPANVTGTGFSAPDASIEPVGDGWYRCILTATSNADAALRAYVQCHNGSGTSYAGDTGKGLLVWGVQIEDGDRAGLLLVPEMLPDTVTAERIEPGDVIPDTPETYANDPDNLLTATWSVLNTTETLGQPDPAGGTQARRFTADTSTSAHYVRTSQATLPSGPNTAAIYLKKSGSSSGIVRVLFSGTNSTEGYVVSVNLDAGTVSAPTLIGGSGYSAASSEIIVLAGGWVWVRITQSMSPTSLASVFVTFRDSNPSQSYAGSSAYGIYTWRQQIVAGATIDKPTQVIPGYEEPSTIIPAETIATGNQAGAYIWPVPGDADALYRVELDDASVPVMVGEDEVPVAVNRVHIGAWGGRLGEGQPFSLLAVADGASASTGGLTQVGTWVPGVTTDDTWRTIGSIDDSSGLPPGRYDMIARIRDTAVNMGAPTIGQVRVSNAIYAQQRERITHQLDPGHTSLTITDIQPTQQGSLLLLFAQAIGPTGPWGTPQMSATITDGGGLTWSSLFASGPSTTLGKAQAWYVANAAPIGSTLTVQWRRGATPVQVAEDTVTVSLIEVIGAAADPIGPTDTDYLDKRFDASLFSGVASATPTEVGGLAIAAGLGWNEWINPITVSIIDNDAWSGVSSLTSGSIMARPIPSLDPIQSQWMKAQVSGMYPDPEPEGWYVLLALIKSAVPSGSNIGTGTWSVCVTAVSDEGVESLPSELRTVTVPSTGSAVTVPWLAPENGTAAKYRVYRNRGSGWGYFETTDGNATSYTFTTETGITAGSPPTATSPIAALRMAVSTPAGRTILIGRSTSVRRANGIWEPVALGPVTLPPVAPGEGTMPAGWRVLVQARNSAAYPVECNGLWPLSVDAGQVQAWRVRQDATEPRSWIIDTSRDELTTAVLMDGANDAGQVALVPGPLTLPSGGGAHVSVRPDVIDGISDLVNADLRIRRVSITPRWTYIAGGAV